MEQKLTREEKERVFMQYLGAKCEYGYEGNTPRVGKIIGNDVRFGIQVLRSGVGFEFVPYENVNPDLLKMRLHSLSSISDEHAIEVAKMFGHPSWFKAQTLDVYRNEVIASGKQYALGNTGLADCLPTVSMFQYLIQQGYAVSLFFGVGHWANGKTAIDLKIAIDKTIVNV